MVRCTDGIDPPLVLDRYWPRETLEEVTVNIGIVLRKTNRLPTTPWLRWQARDRDVQFVGGVKRWGVPKRNVLFTISMFEADDINTGFSKAYSCETGIQPESTIVARDSFVTLEKNGWITLEGKLRVGRPERSDLRHPRTSCGALWYMMVFTS